MEVKKPKNILNIVTPLLDDISKQKESEDDKIRNIDKDLEGMGSPHPFIQENSSIENNND